MNAPDLLLPYQRKLLETTARVVVYEKSRRIGISWAAALAAVLAAATAKDAGGMDVLYIGYNLEMARDFIGDCATWAKGVAAAAQAMEEFVWRDPNDRDGDKDIQAFRIRFASGFEIVALSSRPRSLRGKQGFVILDEAAFHDDLAELIKAAMALLIWGGKVLIVSTHDGDANPFNELVKDTRAGKLPHQLLRTTFREALDDGLYKRICAVKGEEWTPAREAEWEAEIRAYYGENAAEELDVIPRASTGAYFTRAHLEPCMADGIPIVRIKKPREFMHDPNRAGVIADWIKDELQPIVGGLPGAPSYIGQDFARHGDASVLWVMQKQDRVLRTAFILEMRELPFDAQKQIGVWLGQNLPLFQQAAFDATGNGAGLAEGVAQDLGATRVQSIHLSNRYYAEWFPKYRAAFEDKTITIPKSEDLIADHRLVELVKGVPAIATRRVKGSDGEWRHGDAAVAGLLAFAVTAQDVAPIEFQSAGRRLGGQAYDLGRANFNGWSL